MQPFFDDDQLVGSIIESACDALRATPSWDALEARISATFAIDLDPPLLWLRSRQGLSRSEERVIWLMIANELDLDARSLIRQRSSEETCDVPFDTLRRVVYSGDARLHAWRELGPEGKLRRLGYLVRTDGQVSAPEHRQTFKLGRRVLGLAHGDVGLDCEARAFAALDLPTSGLDELVVEGAVESGVADAMQREGKRLIIVHGPVGFGRRSILTGVARRLGRNVLTVDAGKLSSDRELAKAQLRAVDRECSLLACLPLIVSGEALDTAQAEPRLDLLESELSMTVMVASRAPLARRWQMPVHSFELSYLTQERTAEFWRAILPSASESDGYVLASTYPLAPALIRAAAKASIELAGVEPLTPTLVRAGIRTILEDHLSGFARRLPVLQTFQDLVLPEEQSLVLAELVARVRGRGRVYEEWGFGKKVGKGLGVSALFSGPPGTGKTMAATLIGLALELEVFQVDTSKITSKWIGETEKNLASLFDAAEACHAILLFDEADALFAKRSEVKSSNDRHANQEVNFLLQRLETFRGICILTTNLEHGIDDAFRRRLSFHLRFAVPDEDEREKLWRAMLPAQAPVDANVDFTGLARRYAMTGGYIKNAALRAAFLAADEGKAIGDAHLEYAARLEYEGMGKIAMPAGNWPAKMSATL